MLILAPNLNIFQRILWQPLIEDISKFPTLEIKSKIKIQKGKLFFFLMLHTRKPLTQSENSLKIDLSSSQKTQRSELISSSTGWFAVVSCLISDDKRAVDRLNTLCHPISDYRSVFICFVSRELSKKSLVFSLVFSLSIGRYFSSSPLV